MNHKILPVFLPFIACGERCIYCDQKSITKTDEPEDVVYAAEKQICDWLNISNSWDEVAFYGGNFGALTSEYRKKLYNLAFKHNIKNIRYSTRPDTITDEILNEVIEYKIHCVELGVQTLSDKALISNKRPYNRKDAIDAVEQLTKITQCGVQMMVGMYDQTLESAVDDAKLLAQYNIKTARIYPTVIFKNTKLHKLLTKKEYIPVKLSLALAASAGMYIHFLANNINVIRMGLPYCSLERDNIIAGAVHESFGDMVKTLVVFLYNLRYSPIKYSGYKGLIKKYAGADFDNYDDIDNLDFVNICKKLREVSLEDSKRFIEGAAFDFAKQLESASDNR